MQLISISQVSGLSSTLSDKLASTSYTASDVFSKVLTLDGAASGLDSDLLDGQEGSYYLAAANFTGTLAAARLPAFTGDITTSAGSSATTLATVNSNVGSFGSATQVATFTVNAKGLTTAASNVTITPAWSSITSKPTTLSGYGITDAQGLDTGLTSLAGLTGAGVVTATATDTFAMRAIGTTNSTDILTRADGDGRFAPLTGSWRDQAIPVGAWQRTTDGTNRFHFASSSHTYFGTGNTFYFRNSSDSTIVTISSGGNLSAIGDVTAYSSDARLKTNIRPIADPLGKIDRISGYIFDWDEAIVRPLGFQPYQYQDEHGFLAQEIAEVMPDAVRPAPFNPEYLTVKYERVVPLAIAAIKELKSELESLKDLLRQKGII